MAEGHIGEDAEFSFQRWEQALIDRSVYQVADQRRVPTQPVGEGIVFEALFFKIEQESRGLKPQI